MNTFFPGDIVHLKLGDPCPNAWIELSEIALEIIDRNSQYDREVYTVACPEELVAAVVKKNLGWNFKPIRRETGLAAAIDIAVCYLEEMDTTPDATPVSEIDQMF